MTMLTDRVAILKDAATTQKYSDLMFAQRDFWFYRGVMDCPENADFMTLTASGLISALINMKPLIFPGELIVGYNYADGNNRYDKTSNERTPFHHDDVLLKMQKTSLLTEDQVHWLIENRAQAVSRQTPSAPQFSQVADSSVNLGDLAADNAASSFIMTDNHTVPGYEMMLQLGIPGMLAKIEIYKKRNGDSSLYSSCRRIMHAFRTHIGNYAAEAARQAQAETELVRRVELERISDDCYYLCDNPPANFRQAVQLLWFSHVMNTLEDYINANSLGRLDQILYPFYQRDLEAGIITKEEAFELICCLWIKLYRNYDVQQSALGGTNPDGSSAVNELSYMMLDATEQLDFIRCLSVRYGSNSEPAFVKRALEVVAHVQKGIPFFFNDDVLIPALESAGISREDACNYSQIGCVETVIPGKHNPHAVTAKCNLLKCLEYLFANGSSMMKPELTPGIQTGELAEFKTFEDFLDALKSQIAHMVEETTRVLAHVRPHGKLRPKPVKSMLTEGCLESGRDFNDCGALYDSYQVMLIGVPNLADSLMVIKDYVYRKKLLTLPEMKQILEDDFPDEAQRLEWINLVPKYGNDMGEVDNLAADILNYTCDCMDAMGQKYGISLHAQPFTYLWMVEYGATTAATPDGRRKGEIIAYSMSPMQGRDFNGFTALINSLCKLPTMRTPGTTSAIVEVDPHLLTAKNLPQFTQIMLAAAKMGLSNVQFNITDAETLIDAQKHPEAHRNLAVRVSGFSQRFEYLDKPLQDHIIARTKHRTM